MKAWFWTILTPLLILATSCSKNSDQLQTKKDPNDTIPKYDSLNWAKEYKFGKVDKQDFARKRSFMEQFYKEFWEKGNVSGGIIVAQHGKIIFEAYSGYSDIENQIPITAETPIHIASISKVLTSLAVLKLVENKKIDLNEKVSKYLKGFPYEDVRVEDLMNHRSGLPNYLHLSDDKNYWDNRKKMTNQDLLDIFINLKPAAINAPGKKFAYNNTNFVMLALIIEKVTGLSYPQAMKHIVFNPLGMKNTFVMEFDKDSARVSKSYYNNGKLWAYDHLDKTYGDKNIYSTPRDLLAMDIAMYSDKFLPKELKEKAWKGYSYESKGVKNYGLGIRMMEWENGSKILYHNGLWHGNNTVYVRDFNHEATIITLGNRKNRTIYSTFRLASLFGDYPFQADPLHDSGESGSNVTNQLQRKIDSAKGKSPSEKPKQENSKELPKKK